MTDIVKVYVSRDNTATFICPHCQQTRISDVSKYKHINKAIRVKCRCICGNVYTSSLERRQNFRKSTHLLGKFICGTNGSTRSGRILVKDISRTGLKFEVMETSLFKIGDKLSLEFELDDSLSSKIRKDVIAKNLSNKAIGAEFDRIDPYDTYDNRIGFYLFNA